MLTSGQQQALDELRHICNTGDSIELVDHELSERGLLIARISIAAGFQRNDQGIRFRPREILKIEIAPDFPWHYPHVSVPHRRWAGRPHVNYCSRLCLYVAPDVEWNASDGMYGLVGRLVEWLERAALDELDPDASPLHPPYAPVGSAINVIVRYDSPRPVNAPWFGFSAVERRPHVFAGDRVATPCRDPVVVFRRRPDAGRPR